MGVFGYGRPGEIYRGTRYVVTRRTRAGQQVVVKAVRPECPDLAGARARLDHEHALLVDLRLPGIVRVAGLEDGDSGAALVLEDAGQQTLEQWQGRRPLAPERFLPIATGLAEALTRLHDRRIIHRDINPTNVVIGEGGRVTLIDFDAASATDGPADRGGVPAHRGTALAYCSPEETGRVGRLVDGRADLYSLGATFYEMLTGAPPFVTRDPVELVHAHLARSPLPPAQANPAVPELLSELVLKLLAKMPEARYQSADALLWDLREAEARLRSAGDIDRFELGLADLARELALPETLYQREQERAALLGAWDRAATGDRGVVVLAGPAGVGKSALAAELRGPVGRRSGRLLTGKAELRRSSTPYAPVVQALQQLAASLHAQAEAGEEGARTARRLQEALGSNTRVVTDLCPELEPLAGTAPPLPALGPIETENRFCLTLRAFVQALATAERPLVLLIEDLQWVDPASLRLLRVLADRPHLHHLLLVVTCRSEEVGSEHPARSTLEALLADGPPAAVAIELPALTVEAITAFCGAALRCEPERARPLAELVLRKTGGNPFFVRRLLRYLHKEDLLGFDRGAATWSWDLARIENVGVTDNVAGVLLATLARLPFAVQVAVRTVACLGHQAPLGTVAAVTGQTREATAGALQVAVKEGLLVALDAEAGPSAPDASFQFVHDRVQQAAYSLLSEADRRAVHLSAGRQLLRERAGGPLDDRLFAAVDQFESAAPLADPAERLAVAELNLRAADRARASSAYASALVYLRRGIALFPAEATPEQAALAFTLHRDALACACLIAEGEQVDELFRAALALARSPADQAELYWIRARDRITALDNRDALYWVQAGLRLFGAELPEVAPGAALGEELAALAAELSGRRADDLLAVSGTPDPDHRVIMDLLATALTATYFERQDLWPVVLARLVSLSLRRGLARSSPFAFTCFGVLLSRQGNYPAGLRVGRLAIELVQRMGDPVEECRTVNVFVSILSAWLEPLDSRLPLQREVQVRGLAAGELTFGFTASTTVAVFMFHRGAELSRVLAELETGIALVRTTRMTAELEMLIGCQRVVHHLTGLSPGGGCVEPEGQPCRHVTLWLANAYLFRDFAGARGLLAASEASLPTATRSVTIVDHTLYAALVQAAGWEVAEPAEQARLRAAITAGERQLAGWAAGCPENYRQKWLLLQAELARIEQRPFEAAELYDEAIETAGRQAFLRDEALAAELAGRFHRAQGRKRFAGLYLGQALEAYLRWGARAKAEALEEEFPELRQDLGSPAPARDPDWDDARGADLDLVTLLRAAEAIAGEVVLSRLLGKLMEVCLATAGAERGALVLEEEGGPFVRAVGSISDGVALTREPALSGRYLPAAVVERARRDGETVVLADASAHEELGQDPYLAAGAIRSVLATPIVRQAKRVGVLYLENNLATRVFTAGRVQILQLLSAQIAIALENSLLFEELTHEIEDRQRAETALGFLAEAGAALSESLDHERTLARLARLAVSFLADWCAVELSGPVPGQRAAVAHRDPAREVGLQGLFPRPKEEGAREAVPRTFETSRSVLFSDLSETTLGQFLPDPEVRGRFRALGGRSGMILPLVAGDRWLGVIALVSDDPDRRYGPRELALAEELARRAAAAIDNARLYREAREAVRLRDEFLSIASHELNTPIASLQLLAQAIEQGDLDPTRPTITATMRIISRQTKRLAGLVKELLDVSHIQGKWLHLDRQPVDLGELVQETVARFAEDLRRAGCALTAEVDAGVVGRWDRARLDQVITNLLGNAVKFAPGKTIEIEARARGGKAHLAVRDHGIGIPQERIPHIFGRFERAVSAAHYGGLGLGLYIVHEIVVAHGGTVAVQSAEGSGSTFSVELPLA